MSCARYDQQERMGTCDFEQGRVEMSLRIYLIDN